jgi:hypothetical protein
MSASRRSVRFALHLLWMVAVALLAWVIVSPLGDRLETVSDALGWQVLPWVLLAVFWAFVSFKLWRGCNTHDQIRES